jgi:predicted ATPase
MRTLQKLTIEGFRSIGTQEIALQPLNVLIGGNGAGKSNLIEVFRLLREIVTQNLGSYVVKKGGANNLLHFGRKNTKTIHLHLEFGDPASNTTNAYRIYLRPTDTDTLFVAFEASYYHNKVSHPTKPYDHPLAANVPESTLREATHISSRQVLADLERYRVYHFHDTSDTAEMKGYCDINDNRFLREQAQNLPAFLYWLRERKPDHYKNIVATIRRIAPFFDDFVLHPSRLNESKIRLEWRERGSDAYFNATSLSDGTLRFICLTTLLLQPDVPPLVILDEPELGLHPAAINLVAALLTSASSRAQVIAATQSVTLVNQFAPEQVWAVEKRNNQSEFNLLSTQDMASWLDEYSLGELWEKNIIGARP